MTENDALERALIWGGASDPPPLPDLSEAAAAAGLLDVAYATLDSPVGRILLALTPRGLVRLAYLDGDAPEDAVLGDLAARVSPRVLAAPRRLDGPRRELDQYFAGTRRRFELALDWRLTHGFTRRVLRATARIPYGTVSSYRGVAADAGSPRAFRAAGNALGSNPLPIVVPCHRVLHAGGGLGGYTGGLERKRVLLTVEGILPADQ
ncbi:MAG TPA: methylated-DNA--[protein]-cysteine S-methyltransferase [Solirubrobacteraceae bacterium]|nr:methylated-DNA--[protein]-cysteine S-methyltransferase [Solirubrobacteraceae bacterium]